MVIFPTVVNLVAQFLDTLERRYMGNWEAGKEGVAIVQMGGTKAWTSLLVKALSSSRLILPIL